MPRLRRPILLCLLWIAALGALSLGLYHRPSQAERRLRGLLQGFLADGGPGIAVEGCRATWGGDFFVERLSVPATGAPPGEALAEWSRASVRTDLVSSANLPSGRFSSAGGAAGSGAEAPERAWTRLDAESARFRLEARSPLDGASAPGPAAVGPSKGAARLEWNFSAALQRPPSERESPGSPGLICTARTFEAAISLPHPAAAAARGARGDVERSPLIFSGRDLELVGWPAGGDLAVQATLSGPAPSGGGRFEAVIRPGGEISSLSFHLRNLESVERLLPLLPEPFQWVESALMPRGACDVELREEAPARLEPAREVHGRLRWWDGSIEPEGLGIVVDHVSGQLAVSRDGIGSAGGQEGEAAALVGTRSGRQVRVSCLFRAGQRRVQLQIKDLDFGALGALPGAAWLPEILKRLGLHGRDTVEYHGEWAQAGGGGSNEAADAPRLRWRRHDRVEAAAAAPISLIRSAAGTVRSFEHGDVAAELELDALQLWGSPPLAFKATLSRTPGGLRLKALDGRIGASGAFELDWAFASGASAPSGSLSGRDFDVALPGLLDRISVRTLAMEFPVPPADAGGGGAKLRAALGEASMPAHGLPSGSMAAPAAGLRFDAGGLAGRIDAGGLHIEGLALRGPNASFRFRGRIDGAGGLRGVAILGFGRSGAALARLEDAAPPEQWIEAPRASVSADDGSAGDEALVWISFEGTVAKPSARRVPAREVEGAMRGF
jgi:hypothetical protein